jgi:hypothetical protein
MLARISFAWNKMGHDLFWFDVGMALFFAVFILVPLPADASPWARIFLGCYTLYLHGFSFYGFCQSYCLTTLSAKGEWRALEIGDRQAFIRQAIANNTRDLNCINHPGKMKPFRRLALLFEDDMVAAVTYLGVEENEVAVAAEMRRILSLQVNMVGNRSYSDYYISTGKCGFIFASGTYFAPLRCPVSGAPVVQQ